MKIKYIGIASLIIACNGLADWKEEAAKWNKEDAEKVLQEKREKYNPNKLMEGVELGSDITDAKDKIGGILDKAEGLGLDKYLGGAIGDSKSMLSMVNNEAYQSILWNTGLKLIGGADSALLGVCYEKSFNYEMPDFKMPDIVIDPCIKFDLGFDGFDVCSALPDIPGYKKKSKKILEIDQRNVSLMCKGWTSLEIEKVPLEHKILENDSSKSIERTRKIAENTDVTEKVKRTNVAEINKISKFKFKEKVVDEKGNPVLDENGEQVVRKVTPFITIEKQDTEDKRRAYKYIKKITEREAAEGKDLDDIKRSQRVAIYNSKKANVAYKNEHEYVLARDEAVNKLDFIEEKVFDTQNEILIFRTKVAEYQDTIKDPIKKASQIKAEKDNLIIQYKKRVDDWLKIKEAYYYEYEKKGISSPTKYYIDTIAKSYPKEEQRIKRASLVRQVDEEMNMDAQKISKLRIKAKALVREFERKLDIEEIAGRKFDLEAALEALNEG